MVLLPIVFMVHDFEEVIMFEQWLAAHREELHKRFPKMAVFVEKQGLFEWRTATFAVAVAHEFVLLSAVSYISIYTGAYEWWFAGFMAYFLHLLMHIVQWLVFKRYVPVIITSLASLPYCGYTLWLFCEQQRLSIGEMCLFTLVGVIIALLSFPSAFGLARLFRKYVQKY